jgi:hypothetical protein
MKFSFCLAVGQRSKRRKVEKKSASAFEKLRELKKGGTRDKWGAEESSKIYDEVDEDEYSKLVSARAGDWIVDDGEFCAIDYRLIFADVINKLTRRRRICRRRSRDLRRR